MRITVLGVGLIGGSIGLAARARLDAEIAGFDPDRDLLDRATELEAIDSAHDDVAAVGSDSRFIGGHPLAGAETSGVENARADLFEGARWYLTPTPKTGGLLYDRVQRAIAEIGARPQAIEAETHDRLMATISHLPHVLANVLVTQAA